MLALMLGLAVTGFMMARGNEGPEELHELMAYAMCAVVGVHILGVALHTVRHKENLTLGMIRGTKEASAAEGIASVRPFAAAAFLLFVGALAVGLVRNYDAARQTTRLPLLGTVLQIGEAEQGDVEQKGGDEHERDDDESRAGADPARMAAVTGQARAAWPVAQAGG